jgi:hypothetical protein
MLGDGVTRSRTAGGAGIAYQSVNLHFRNSTGEGVSQGVMRPHKNTATFNPRVSILSVAAIQGVHNRFRRYNAYHDTRVSVKTYSNYF